MAAISEGLVASRSEFESLHWDERVFLLRGLAELLRLKFGGGSPAAAHSLGGGTVDSVGGDSVDDLAELGFNVTKVGGDG